MVLVDDNPARRHPLESDRQPESVLHVIAVFDPGTIQQSRCERNRVAGCYLQFADLEGPAVAMPWKKLLNPRFAIGLQPPQLDGPHHIEHENVGRVKRKHAVDIVSPNTLGPLLDQGPDLSFSLNLPLHRRSPGVAARRWFAAKRA